MKTVSKPAFDHHLHQCRIIGQIDRGLSVKRYFLTAFLPLDECGQEMGLEIDFVADKVVIHKKDGSTPSSIVNLIQLGNNLLGSFHAWPMPQ